MVHVGPHMTSMSRASGADPEPLTGGLLTVSMVSSILFSEASPQAWPVVVYAGPHVLSMSRAWAWACAWLAPASVSRLLAGPGTSQS